MFKLSIQEIQSVSGAGQCELVLNLKRLSDDHLIRSRKLTNDCDKIQAKLDDTEFKKRYDNLIKHDMILTYTLTEV